MRIQFEVFCKPQPQGSARAFVPRGWNRAIITSDNKTLKPWRQDVSAIAQGAMEGREMAMGAVRVSMDFWFSRPKSTKKAVIWKITKPDLDKLIRSILDSMSGIVFKDDSQVVEVNASKIFQDAEGVSVVVETLL